MKNVISLALVLAIAGISFAQDKEEEPLFDMASMDNCTICKCMSNMKSEMMKVKWETHVIDNGLVTVTVVPDDLKGKWSKCKKSMDETIAKLDGSEDLCNFCSAFGGLIEAGAKKQEIESAGVQIMMLTSDDPEVAAKIKKMGKRMVAETKKMKEMMEKMMQQQKG